MSRQNVVDARFEEFIAMKCANFANLDWEVTPQNQRYDFRLLNEIDVYVVGEIKVRNPLYPDWFIEKDKSDWLVTLSQHLKCAPWYVIHCEFNKTTYQINLNHDFEFRTGDMYGEPGIFVGLDHWTIVPPLGSTDARMSPLDWK
jgi:hypothetical protein